MAYSAQGESSSNTDAFNSTPRYDVFLSFAGKDTRLKFTDHLYAAFTGGGIQAFRDEEGIERGEVVSHRLLQAIKHSLCAVVVLSTNYANSTWCLDELQMIIERRSKFGQRVFPIFYDIDPSDVRRHRNFFGDALAKHEERFREIGDKVQNWRNALYEISNISGWVTRDRREADLIKIVVKEVWNYLITKLPSCDENIVGLGSSMAEVMSRLEIGSDEVHFVGIWGMGSIGKTTLARAVYEKISDRFEACCFLSNVRETSSQREGIVSLQRKLLLRLKVNDITIDDEHEGKKILRNLFSKKKVLLVFDDVADLYQIQNLAQGPKWFSAGSRVIMTARDSHLFTTCKMQKRYEMEFMEKDESLQLFSIKAFKKDSPEKDYRELSKSVVQYAGSLPLALDVLGKFLCGRTKDQWRDALGRLKQIPNDILQKLKISYDGLHEEEKAIFLDIACFFKGWRKKEVTQILKSCDLHPTIGIEVLIEKALLVETEYSRLDMHDLLVDLGRHIVFQESPKNVGKRSRLWELDDIKEVLVNNKGSEAIQAIVMQYYDEGEDPIEVYPEAFSKISNIRLLLIVLYRVDLDPFPLILPRGLRLSSALKVVRWDSFPFEALPIGTPLDKLVHIQMRFSKIKKLWNEGPSMKMLKHIDLCYCDNLIETPDFSGVPHLEYLCLLGCLSLAKVHPSLGRLAKLVEVNLHCCPKLEILPTKLETNSLIKVKLDDCDKLAVLPEFGEGMKKLSYLDVSHNAITILPESLGYLTGLRCLKSSRKVLTTNIIFQICDLKITWLTELYLSKCGLSEESIPDDFVSLPSLIVLDLSFNDFVNLPTGCFSSLSRPLFLSLDYCHGLKSLPKLPPQLVRLSASGYESMAALSSDGGHLWDMVASLDHKLRGQTKYVISSDDDADDDEDPDVDTTSWVPNDFMNNQAEWFAPLRDFCAFIRGSEIPSWFPNKEYYPQHKKERRGEYVIELEVKIPPDLHDSEWSGIVVCLNINLSGFAWWVGIGWTSKGVDDDKDGDHMYKQWAHVAPPTDSSDNLCIMVLELNEQKCWQHLRGPNNNNSLHVNLSVYDDFDQDTIMMGCGWRVICKEEI